MPPRGGAPKLAAVSAPS